MPFSADVSGLAAGEYFYCAVVSTPGGTTYGGVESFAVGEAQIDAGCGCGTGSGSAASIWFGLLVLGMAVRRRLPRGAASLSEP